VHRQALDNTKRRQKIIQTYVEQIGVQNEGKNSKKKKEEQPPIDDKKKNKYITNNGTLFWLDNYREKIIYQPPDG
jgi:hypothetical protein